MEDNKKDEAQPNDTNKAGDWAEMSDHEEEE